MVLRYSVGHARPDPPLPYREFQGGRQKKSRSAMKTPPATKPKNWTELEKQQLERLVRSGAHTQDIARKLGRYAGSVKKMARQMKLVVLKK
jgi:hypothetical protein